MSRVGKLPVAILEGVKVDLTPNKITIKGKLGELTTSFPQNVIVTYENSVILVKPANDSKEARAMWGTVRNNINNMVKGVVEGFTIRLEIFGVGYKASSQGQLLTMSLGYSHDVIYAVPNTISIKCEKPTLIVIFGADKQAVGQVAGELMKLRPLEPYKGKGIYPEGTKKRKKEGKKK